METESAIVVLGAAVIGLALNIFFELGFVVGSLLSAGICGLLVCLELFSEEEEKEWAIIGVFSILCVSNLFQIGTTMIGWGNINPLVNRIGIVICIVGFIIHFACYRFNVFPKPIK